ncbi:unnamed protein product [Parascedosporium putredinis]|uniref:DUF7143 domain-containing protein n=1 Tax=Parascedosporium putredinis TaxID=1442378 RepID=A0A9P1MB30_9PEZI|nr:unnamed protein product [Parascedosporium putredinis]CAI7995206.1 unnamed protein product [Parascedosporium putredinis]
MRSAALLLAAAGIAYAVAPTVAPRQANACFVIGNEVLPQSVVDTVTAVQGAVSCRAGSQTLSGVPDVTSGGINFSDVNFADSDLSPLEFALTEFASANPLADTDLQRFEDTLNVYLATEAGIRSVAGGLTIKVPKFFLEFQVSRIQTAQGNPPTAAGLQVDHLLDKVLKNAASENAALLDQVRRLATQLA